MKLFINIILVLIVLAGLGGMIYLSVNGNRFWEQLVWLRFTLLDQSAISLTVIRLKNVVVFK